MFTSFMITFRETLEAALIIGIVLAYLNRSEQRQYAKHVHWGLWVAIAASAAGAAILNMAFGGFEGRAEEIFEGVTMWLAAGLVTTLIVWMAHKRNIATEITRRVEVDTLKGYGTGIFFFVFFTVFREGMETVLFLNAARFSSTGDGVSLFGGLLGIVSATVLGFVILTGTKRIPLKRFFDITTGFLILFGAGLVAHGTHELEEAGVLNPIIDKVWDINPALLPNGAYPLLHEKGMIGAFFKTLFGYNGDPSLLEVSLYVSYFVLIFWMFTRVKKMVLAK